MISIRNVNLYCKEDISLIQNYDKAINDTKQIWDCHHRKETDEGLSIKQLDELGLYYNRPASELIFLTREEHMSLHNNGKPSPNRDKHLSEEHKNHLSESMKGKHHSEKTRKRISEAMKGENNPMFGKHPSDETRKKQSESHKGKESWIKGKHLSEETRKKQSEANKGKHRVYHEDGTFHYEK